MRPLVTISRVHQDTPLEKLKNLSDTIATIFDAAAVERKDEPRGASISFPCELVEEVNARLIVQVRGEFAGDSIAGSQRAGLANRLMKAIADILHREAECYVYTAGGECRYYGPLKKAAAA